jgi:hypothetical protein
MLRELEVARGFREEVEVQAVPVTQVESGERGASRQEEASLELEERVEELRLEAAKPAAG